MNATTDRLLSHLSGVRNTGTDRWIAQCPAHQDRSPSLSIRALPDKVLIRCFAGCTAADIMAAVGLTVSDLFNDSRSYRPNPALQRRLQALDMLEAWRESEIRRIGEELRTRDIIIRQIDE